MAAEGPASGERRSSSYGHRHGLLAIATMIGFVAAGVALGIGASRIQAAGLGLLTLGLTLWFGSMRAPQAASDIDERTRRQRHRSVAIALGLGTLVAIFYVATIVRLGPNAIKKDGMGEIGSKNRVLSPNDPAICKKVGTC